MKQNSDFYSPQDSNLFQPKNIFQQNFDFYFKNLSFSHKSQFFFLEFNFPSLGITTFLLLENSPFLHYSNFSPFGTPLYSQNSNIFAATPPPPHRTLTCLSHNSIFLCHFYIFQHNNLSPSQFQLLILETKFFPWKFPSFFLFHRILIPSPSKFPSSHKIHFFFYNQNSLTPKEFQCFSSLNSLFYVFLHCPTQNTCNVFFSTEFWPFSSEFFHFPNK